MTTDELRKVVPLFTEAARQFGVPRTAMLDRGRVREIVKARHAVMWALRDAGWTYMAIGALFGRDHTTVISDVAEAERRALSDPDYALRLAAIR